MTDRPEKFTTMQELHFANLHAMMDWMNGVLDRNGLTFEYVENEEDTVAIVKDVDLDKKEITIG